MAQGTSIDGTLVTGFLSFGRFAVNPSGLLAERCGRAHELIEVTFSAADAFVESLESRSFDRLLLMGVAGSSSAFRLERRGINKVGASPDASGTPPPGEPIELGAPESIAATLWSTPAVAQLVARDDRIVWSDCAGDYLCNYIYFRSLQRLPEAKIGFLHVPPEEAMALDEQAAVLAEILRAIETPPPFPSPLA